jgi:hypothetical protein
MARGKYVGNERILKLSLIGDISNNNQGNCLALLCALWNRYAETTKYCSAWHKHYCTTMSSGSSIFCPSREEKKKILLKLMMRSTLAEKQEGSWTGDSWRATWAGDSWRAPVGGASSRGRRSLNLQLSAATASCRAWSRRPCLPSHATVVEGASGSGWVKGLTGRRAMGTDEKMVVEERARPNPCRSSPNPSRESSRRPPVVGAGAGGTPVTGAGLGRRTGKESGRLTRAGKRIGEGKTNRFFNCG